MKLICKKLLGLFLVYFILLNSLFSNNQIKSQNPVENTTREFRGYFPDRKHVGVRINFTLTDTTIIGVMQFEGEFKTSSIEGGTDTSRTLFHLQVLNEVGDPTGTALKGVIEQNIMKASYISSEKSFDFEFVEIDLKNPPPFIIDPDKVQNAYEKLANDFQPVTLPHTFQYEANAKVIQDATFFLDKEIVKLGSSSGYPPITLMKRINILRKLTYGGRIDFNNGCKGLILNAHFDSALDGELFASYIYIFDSNECFATAFVIFEAFKIESPFLVTKLSRSQIFNITEYDVETTFKITEKGEIEPLEH